MVANTGGTMVVRERLERLRALALVVVTGLAGAAMPAVAQEELAVSISYITQEEDKPRPLSLLDPVLTDEGLAGARQAIGENQTTGQFLKHDYRLNEIVVPEDGDLVAAFKEALAAGERFFVADVYGDQLLALADFPEAEGALIFNTRAPDDELRTDQCRANVFHIMPSRAMKADGLAQYLVWKQWFDWFLIHGTLEPDLAFAEALQRAATKFNGNIVETRAYEYTPTARRTDTGHVQTQRQIPMLTQEAEDHDVVVVADESDVFGEYVPYRTWEPRPVVGTAGLIPTAWHRAHEQWGGTQMQNRFEQGQGRAMTERDYTAWLAVRSLGEAVTRTNDNDPQALREYLRSEEFSIGAFKGEGLTFRTWNQQMRQPILLAAPRTLVSVSPQEGFLHQRTPLDTLGFDEPESSCRLE
jgi:ABC transporter substrate binding protein (PQQ-dependent alcohol dehydrogenase system)